MVRTHGLSVLAISTIALALASCVEPPIAGVETDAEFAVTGGEPVDRVVLTSEFTPPDGSATLAQAAFSVHRHEDGVALREVGAPSPTAPSLRALDASNQNRIPATAGVMRLSEGTRLLGEDGQEVQRSGAVVDSDGRITAPPDMRLGERERPDTYRGVARRTRIVTSEQGQEDLEALRVRADDEERVSNTRISFSTSLEGVVETWLYDEDVGAIVEHTFAAPGRPSIRITNEYRRAGNGFELIASVTEWIGAEGVFRRVERAYNGS